MHMEGDVPLGTFSQSMSTMGMAHVMGKYRVMVDIQEVPLIITEAILYEFLS